MKSAKLACIIGIALSTLLATSVRLAAQQHPPNGLSNLPMDLQPSVSAALGRDLPEYQAQARSGGFKAQNAQHNLAADFTSEGVAVRGANIFWRMTLCGYGYGVALTPSHTTVPKAKLNRVEYHHGSLTEWYVNGPAGLEQGFTITKRPGQARDQPLTIALSLSRDLTAVVDQNRTGLSLKGA
jgi:trimeric autotransporter adhesin